MARPPIERAVEGVPRITLFKPAGVPARELEQLQLTVDELEAIRLVDLEALSHEQAAEAMGVSRQTVGRVLERGRAKVAEALVGGKAILIGGGQYRVAADACAALPVRSSGSPMPKSRSRVASCPKCGSTDVAPAGAPGARCGRQNGRDDRDGPRGPAAAAVAVSAASAAAKHRSTNRQSRVRET